MNSFSYSQVGNNASFGQQVKGHVWSNRRHKIEISDRGYVWLWESHHGVIPKEITACEGISNQRIQVSYAHRRSEELIDLCNSARRPPRLVPLFPMGNYTPRSLCGHNERIKRGSIFCCMICHSSGQDHHPALQNDSSSGFSRNQNWRDALPNVRSCERISSETRKQRRQRLFGGIPKSAK